MSHTEAAELHTSSNVMATWTSGIAEADLEHHVAQTLENIDETGWSKSVRQFYQLTHCR